MTVWLWLLLSCVIVGVFAFIAWHFYAPVPRNEFKKLHSHSPIPAWLLDLHGNILEQNHSANIAVAPSQLALFETENTQTNICTHLLQEAITEACHRNVWLHDHTSKRQFYRVDVLHLGRQVFLVQAHALAAELQQQKQWRQHLLLNTATGLPNRALSIYQLEQALQQAYRLQQQLGVFLIDWPEKSRLVSSFGDASLAILIRQSGQHLGKHLNATFQILQPQADQLMLLYPLQAAGRTAWFECYHLAEQIQLLCRQFHQEEGCDILLESCVGAALFPDSAEHADGLLHAASQALWRARKNPTLIQVGLFQPLSEQPWLLQSQQQIQEAIAQYQFELWFQPVYQLSSSRLQSFQVEARWQSTEGLLRYTDYKDCLTHASLQVALERWMLTTFAELMRQWRAQFKLPHFRLTLSHAHLLQDELPEFLIQLTKDYPELTHHCLLCFDEQGWLAKPQEFLSQTNRLHSLGFRLVLIGVGQGMSALPLLQLPLWHEVELAAEFTQGIDEDDQQRNLCSSMIRIFAHRNIPMTANQISTEIQAHILQILGVSYAAGMAFTPALSAQDIPNFLIAEAKRADQQMLAR